MKTSLLIAASLIAIPAFAESGQQPSGGILELQVGSELSLAGASSNGGRQPPLLGVPQGRLFAGWKMGSVILGLGVELTRVGYTSGTSGGSQPSTTNSNSATS